MIDITNNSKNLTLVAIDIAKKSHDALIQFANGHSVQMKIENSLQGYQRLWVECCKHASVVRIGFEPTADYHRNVAYWF